MTSPIAILGKESFCPTLDPPGHKWGLPSFKPFFILTRVVEFMFEKGNYTRPVILYSQSHGYLIHCKMASAIAGIAARPGPPRQS